MSCPSNSPAGLPAELAALLRAHAAVSAQLQAAMEAPQWYLALSGGLDSTVLLDVLCEWRRRYPEAPPLTAIHVDHQLQSQSGDWRDHCEVLCQRLGVPLITEMVVVQREGGGVEDAARRARYRVFERHVQPRDCLFTGHHLDDQIETFFLRLLRGAGLDGLAGMPAERPLGAGTLARPLLSVSRHDLEQYALERGLLWVEDPSNADTDMDRNFLRQELLPLIASRWPGYRHTVSRAVAHIAAAAAAPPAGLPLVSVHTITGDPGFCLSGLLTLPPGTVMSLVRNWLQERGLPMPALAPLTEFTRQLLQAGEDRQVRLQWGAHVLQRYRQGVYLLPVPATFQRPAVSPKLTPGEPLTVSGVGELRLLPVATGGIQLQRGQSLQLNWRSGGERCQPVGRCHSRSLKKLLQETGVPPWWRQRLPLLYLGDCLVAVADLCLCQCAATDLRMPPKGSRWQLDWQPATAANRP